jgi:hypothetical protein
VAPQTALNEFAVTFTKMQEASLKSHENIGRVYRETKSKIPETHRRVE